MPTKSSKTHRQIKAKGKGGRRAPSPRSRAAKLPSGSGKAAYGRSQQKKK